MKIQLAIVTAILTFSALASAASLPVRQAGIESLKPAEVYTQANAAFEKEDFTNAEALYSSLISRGFASPELYFNLGNVAYRKGERGRATLWYERALDMAPRDTDIQFNLSLAQAHIKESQSDPLRTAILFFTNDELGAALLALTWCFCLLLGSVLLGWLSSGTGVRFGLVGIGAMLFIVGIWFVGNASYRHQKRAVIISPPGEVRNGPGLDYAVGFTIPEGSDVLVLSTRPDWVQIGLPQQGLKGWLPATDVELVTETSSST